MHGSLRSCVCEKGLELATNFLHVSDKLVFGPLVLLAPELTVVKIALSRWSHRRVPRHTSTRALYLCRRIPPGRSFQQSLSCGSRQGAWPHARGQDSSGGGVAVVICLGAVCMEEGVQVRVQVEV